VSTVFINIQGLDFPPPPQIHKLSRISRTRGGNPGIHYGEAAGHMHGGGRGRKEEALTDVLTRVSLGGRWRLVFQSSPNLMPPPPLPPPPSCGGPPVLGSRDTALPWPGGAESSGAGLGGPRSCPFCLVSPMRTVAPGAFSVFAAAIFVVCFSALLALEFMSRTKSQRPFTFPFKKKILFKSRKMNESNLNILCFSFLVFLSPKLYNRSQSILFTQSGALRSPINDRVTHAHQGGGDRRKKKKSVQLFKTKRNVHSHA